MIYNKKVQASEAFMPSIFYFKTKTINRIVLVIITFSQYQPLFNIFFIEIPKFLEKGFIVVIFINVEVNYMKVISKRNLILIAIIVSFYKF